MKRVLILGSTGFIGNNLLKKLIKKNYKLRILKHKSDLKIKSRNIEIYKGDILNLDSLKRSLENVDIVINLVGQLMEDEKLFEKINIQGNKNLLKESIKKDVKKIILISTINIYGSSKKPYSEEDKIKPETKYAKVKSEVENIYKNFSRKNNLNVVILRLSNVYGSEDKGIVNLLIDSTKKKNKVEINKNASRDFIYIDDATNAIIKTIEFEKEGIEIFNVCTSKKTNLLDLAKLIENISKKEIKKTIKDKNKEDSIFANNKKIRNALNFTPKTDLSEGLKKIFQDIK